MIGEKKKIKITYPSSVGSNILLPQDMCNDISFISSIIIDFITQIKRFTHEEQGVRGLKKKAREELCVGG